MASTAESQSPSPKETHPLVTTVRVENFRSIVKAEVEFGRVTVIVGANGSGKTNLLEAIAVAGADAAGKLGHEFLAARGIRTPAKGLAVSRFPALHDAKLKMHVSSGGGDAWIAWLDPDEVLDPSAGRRPVLRVESGSDVTQLLAAIRTGDFTAFSARLAPRAPRSGEASSLETFLVFSPDYFALRTFADEGQILPLGVRGEGLFSHLVDLSRRAPDVVTEIGERLRVLDWFDGFVIPNDLGPGEKRLAIRDRYLAADVLLDQRSANEGFLFLLFIYTLMLSPDTPRFFAIDNADTSLNPLVCARVVADIAELAKANDKQVILTTHNPALLDGLDLADDEQRLLVCERDLEGDTRFRRVGTNGNRKVPLSEAFVRGYLGGLPRGF